MRLLTVLASLAATAHALDLVPFRWKCERGESVRTKEEKVQ